MAKMIEHASKVKLQFKNVSDPSEVIEFQSTREFDSEEADEFVKKIHGICAPIHNAKVYEVELFHKKRKTSSSEIPPEIKE